MGEGVVYLINKLISTFYSKFLPVNVQALGSTLVATFYNIFQWHFSVAVEQPQGLIHTIMQCAAKRIEAPYISQSINSECTSTAELTGVLTHIASA